MNRLEDLPDLLTVNEATGFLRVSRNTLYAALRAGTVPSIKMGRRVLIPKAGLRRLVDGAVQSGDVGTGAGHTNSSKVVAETRDARKR